MYIQILTKSDVEERFKDYKILKFNKILGKLIDVPVAPEVAIYEVWEGISELELLG